MVRILKKLGVISLRVRIGTNEAGRRLDRFLGKLLKDVPLSETFKALRKGDVKANGKKQKENYSLRIDDVAEIKYIQSNKEKPEEKFTKVNARGMKITYEDSNMLIVEKWSNILVHPDERGKEASLIGYVSSYLNEKGDYLPENELIFTPAPCNRLDKDTSGIVIFGRNLEALRAMNEMIREGKVEEYYNTLVKGKIKDGLYKGHIHRNEEANISRTYDEKITDSKEIAMEVKTLKANGAYSFLEIDLIAGRSHQIRAYLSHLRTPIIGDNKYGDRKLNPSFANKFGLDCQFLYAYKLISRDAPDKLSYLNNKTIIESLPPVFKKTKNDVFKSTVK